MLDLVFRSGASCCRKDHRPIIMVQTFSGYDYASEQFLEATWRLGSILRFGRKIPAAVNRKRVKRIGDIQWTPSGRRRGCCTRLNNSHSVLSTWVDLSQFVIGSEGMEGFGFEEDPAEVAKLMTYGTPPTAWRSSANVSTLLSGGAFANFAIAQ